MTPSSRAVIKVSGDPGEHSRLDSGPHIRDETAYTFAYARVWGMPLGVSSCLDTQGPRQDCRRPTTAREPLETPSRSSGSCSTDSPRSLAPCLPPSPCHWPHRSVMSGGVRWRLPKLSNLKISFALYDFVFITPLASVGAKPPTLFRLKFKKNCLSVTHAVSLPLLRSS